MSEYAKRISDIKYTKGIEIERTYKKFMRSMVPRDKPLKILDVGCGTGLNASKLSKQGHKVIGIDVSPVAIEKFKQTGLECKLCDITKKIPFEDEKFDMVYASDIIEHLVDTEHFISEMYRVLKPSGKVAISTVNSAFWVFRLAGLFGYTVSQIQHPGHIRFFSKKSLENSLVEIGFKSVSISGRNMYFILTGKIFETISSLIERVGFISEIRFKTQKPFWHLSKCSKKANSLWADCLIATAKK